MIKVAKIVETGNVQLKQGEIAYVVSGDGFKDQTDAIKKCKELAPDGTTQYIFVKVGRSFSITKKMEPTTKVELGAPTVTRKKKVATNQTEGDNSSKSDVVKDESKPDSGKTSRKPFGD